MKISGFTFIHNAIESGYPIVEAIRAVQPYVDEVCVVDMQSTDNTRETIQQLNINKLRNDWTAECPVRILNGFWGNEAGETLRQAHSKYIDCAGDVIIHFEGDEVYEDRLIKYLIGHIKATRPENCHYSVFRLQIEQNFQRCRWYPEPVHRVFPRLSGVRKEGHTTDQHDKSFLIMPKNGYLWDCTNCFRDNWLNRVDKQAELRQSAPQYIMTPLHTLHKSELSEHEAQKMIYGLKHWTYTETPFAIPEILKPLVGTTRYKPMLEKDTVCHQ